MNWGLIAALFFISIGGYFGMSQFYMKYKEGVVARRKWKTEKRQDSDS